MEEEPNKNPNGVKRKKKRETPKSKSQFNPPSLVKSKNDTSLDQLNMK
jgi:hypothetical protein